MSREQYRALGVRQSIFPEAQRDRLYDLFEKYRGWLAEAKLFDANLREEELELEEKTLRQMLEVAPDEPRWGTPEARLREMARLQLRINQQRGRKKEG